MKKIISLLIILLKVVSSYSQTITLDTSFGDGGKVLTNITSGNDRIGSLKVLSDNKVLVCGTKPFSVLGNVVLAKYNENGQLDNSFGTNGVLETDLVSQFFYSNMMVVQNDGKILVIGSSSSNNSTNSITYNFALRRYLNNGQIDTSFGTNGLVLTDFNQTGDFGVGIALQSDSKIIIIGHTDNVSVGTGSRLSLARYTVNGDLDASFGISGKLTLPQFAQNSNDYCASIAIDHNDKIIIGANTNAFESNTEDTNFGIVRLNINGALDNSFSTDGIKIIDLGDIDSLSSLIVNDSKVIFAGYSVTNDISQLAVLRLLDNGDLDDDFSNSGVLLSNLGLPNNQFYLSQCKIINDKIYTSGILNDGTNDDFFFISVNADGTFDTSFNQVGFFTYDFAGDDDLALAFDVDHYGKIILAGQTRLDGDRNYALIKLNTTILGNQGFSKNRFSIYPNPFTDSIFIQSRDLYSENSNVEIFDANGRLFYKTEWRENSVFAIPTTASLANGNYFIKITSKSKIEVIKIVKQ